jgi:hypothetical protein
MASSNYDFDAEYFFMEVKRTGIFFKTKGESLTGEIDDYIFR